MSDYIVWIGIGILALFLLIGLGAGLIRGLKRSALHVIFFLVSIVLAYFITKPVTNAILGIELPIGENGSQTISAYIISMVQESFDLSAYEGATAFIEQIPNAVVAPIVFLLLCLVSYLVFHIIYLIVARLCFGKKKKDFQKSKPRRWLGGLVGAVEGFLFLYVLFAPITSLTKTYESLTTLPATQASISAQADDTNNGTEQTHLRTIPDLLSDIIPQDVHDAILAYNDSVVGAISGAGGLDNALFDGLSSFKIDGEKIVIRRELINLADTYNSVVVVYNTYVDGNISAITLTDLKTNVEKVVKDGLFNAVIADAVQTFVVDFDLETSEIQLPEVLVDVVTELKSTFANENLDVAEYLRHDIVEVLNVADKALTDGLIEKFTENEDNSLMNVLRIVDSNQQSVETVASGVLGLNIVKDARPAIEIFVSQTLDSMIETENEVEIGVNLKYQDETAFVAEILNAISELLEADDIVGVENILNSEDILTEISNIENLGQGFTELGEAFDAFRNLQLLTLTDESGTTHVFDNILGAFNISLLGDEVETSDGQSVTLDTYSKFFEFISNPIQIAQDLDLLSFISSTEQLDFDAILDAMIAEMRINENLLSDLLLPFYQLKQASFDTTNVETPNLKAMIFDQLVSVIEDNIDEVDLSHAKEVDTLENWRAELADLTQTLLSLDQGEVTTSGEETLTYLKYLLSDEFDTDTLLQAMIDGEDLKEILNQVFAVRMFQPFVETIFDQIDTEIQNLTGINPQTVGDDKEAFFTLLQSTRVDVVETITQLLDITLSTDLTTDNLTTIGQLMDIIKENAYNEETQTYGVFDNVFKVLIYYMTGEEIHDASFSPAETFSNSEDVKAYFNANGISGNGYYTADYTQIMTELQGVVEFANALVENMPTTTNFDEPSSVEAFVTGLSNSVNAISSADKVAVIENLSKIVETRGETYKFISDEDLASKGEQITSVVEGAFPDAELSSAILILLGIEA